MPNNSILPNEVINKYSNEITFIRNCALSGHIKISSHCYEQISQRNIRLQDVFNGEKLSLAARNMDHLTPEVKKEKVGFVRED
jgi:hypothetical protein